MSETFETILMKDYQISCITSMLKFQVVKWGHNITCQPSHTVHVLTVPILETIISRYVLWRSTVTLKITGTNKATEDFVVNYGVADA